MISSEPCYDGIDLGFVKPPPFYLASLLGQMLAQSLILLKKAIDLIIGDNERADNARARLTGSRYSESTRFVDEDVQIKVCPALVGSYIAAFKPKTPQHCAGSS